MHRFYLKNINLESKQLSIQDQKLIHQIKDVLRLKISDQIIVFNQHQECLVTILDYPQNSLLLNMDKKLDNQTEPIIKINLYQALLKKDDFDWIIQQGTGLGINKFIPLITERTIVRQMSKNKIDRWQKICQEATEQSGRLCIPNIEPVIDLNKIKLVNDQTTINLAAWEADQKNLKKILPASIPQTINLFIGPEGGWSDKEIEILKKINVQPFLFGPRILRAEFAGLAIASAIFYHYS